MCCQSILSESVGKLGVPQPVGQRDDSRQVLCVREELGLRGVALQSEGRGRVDLEARLELWAIPVGEKTMY